VRTATDKRYNAVLFGDRRVILRRHMLYMLFDAGTTNAAKRGMCWQDCMAVFAPQIVGLIMLGGCL